MSTIFCWRWRLSRWRAGCTAGALDIRDYKAKLASAGFTDIEITPTYFDEATIDEANYHRLAVAWGLSYPDYDIGSITRPCEIDDVPRPKETEKPEIPWER